MKKRISSIIYNMENPCNKYKQQKGFNTAHSKQNKIEEKKEKIRKKKSHQLLIKLFFKDESE